MLKSDLHVQQPAVIYNNEEIRAVTSMLVIFALYVCMCVCVCVCVYVCMYVCMYEYIYCNMFRFSSKHNQHCKIRKWRLSRITQLKRFFFHLTEISASQNNACCGAEIRGKQQSKIWWNTWKSFFRA